MGTGVKGWRTREICRRRLGSTMRLTRAAAEPRLMPLSGAKVPEASFPVRTPARYRRYTAS